MFGEDVGKGGEGEELGLAAAVGTTWDSGMKSTHVVRRHGGRARLSGSVAGQRGSLTHLGWLWRRREGRETLSLVEPLE